MGSFFEGGRGVEEGVVCLLLCMSAKNILRRFFSYSLYYETFSNTTNTI
jgi:hypothetical protein